MTDTGKSTPATGMWNLDYNAGAPLDPRVRAAMQDLPEAADANPASPHRLGRVARRVLEEARERIAGVLGVEPIEIVFTSGGTESNNAAIRTGAVLARSRRRALWCSPIEHPSVARAVRAVAARDAGLVRYFAVGASGEVAVPAEDPAPPAFASLILAHHELGVIQDLEPFAAWTRAHEALLHTDASQALGRIPIADAVALADYVTLSPHKTGGPRGIGILVSKRGRPWEPVLHGGSQEMGRRPGTQSPRLAHGAAWAVELAVLEQADRARSMQAALDKLLASLPPGGCRVLCADASRPLLPNTRTLCFAPLAARHLVPALDLEGVLVSYGAACTSGAREPSPVLFAMGLSEHDAAGCLRVSLPPGVDPNYTDTPAVLLSQAVGRLRALR